jgi:hypothetical protein
MSAGAMASVMVSIPTSRPTRRKILSPSSPNPYKV